jgi:HK97 family phage portal protein
MGFFAKVKDAYNSLRSGAPFSGYGGQGFLYNSHSQFDMFGLLRMFTGTKIDYAKEVGDLTQSSLIMAAVNWFGTTLPEAPMQVVENQPDGTKNPLHDHELVKLLNKPNPFYSGSLMWLAFALSWLIDGNVYWLKVRNKRGKVVELWYIPHFMIEPQWPADGSAYISYYLYQVDGQFYKIDPNDVVHFRKGIDPYNTRKGLSPVASILREIFSDNEAANFSACLLKNFGIPGAIISPAGEKATIQPGEREKLKQDFKDKFSGDGRGDPMVLSGAIKVDILSFDPKKMELSGMRRISEERLAAVINIPAIVLGFGVGLEHATMANFKEAREQAYESMVIPNQRLISDEIDLQLLPDFDVSGKLATRHDYSEVRVLQEDQDKLYERMGKAFKTYNLVKLSEARSRLGLKSGPEDDCYYTPPTKQLPPAPDETPATDNSQSENGQDAKKGIKDKGNHTSIAQALPFEYSTKDAHQYSCAMLMLTEVVAEAMKSLAGQIPDEHLADKGREDRPHVTIKYGLHTDKAEDLALLLKDEPPVVLKLGHTSIFEGEEYDVLTIDVESADLVRLNQKICDALDYTDTHPEYVPHATVAYLQSGKGKLYVDDGFMSGTKVTISEVVFCSKGGTRTVIALEG